MDLTEREQRDKEQILALITTKLREQKVKDLSDASIEKALSGCVLAQGLTRVAKKLVADGDLSEFHLKLGGI